MAERMFTSALASAASSANSLVNTFKGGHDYDQVSRDSQA